MLKHFAQDAERGDGVNGLQVVAKIGQQRCDKLLALDAREADCVELVGINLHKLVQQAAIVGIDEEPAAWRQVGK